MSSNLVLPIQSQICPTEQASQRVIFLTSKKQLLANSSLQSDCKSRQEVARSQLPLLIRPRLDVLHQLISHKAWEPEYLAAMCSIPLKSVGINQFKSNTPPQFYAWIASKMC
uniref:Uncharacterized protein n=1 Tax=Micrurus spixii TaxID=129469 RepID=A0A2D4L9W0_9SAUR